MKQRIYPIAYKLTEPQEVAEFVSVNSDSDEEVNTNEVETVNIENSDEKRVVFKIEDQIKAYEDENFLPKRFLEVATGKTVFSDPLAWWKTNGHKFPTLAKMAKKIMGAMGTSTCVERLFSDKKFVMKNVTNVNDDNMNHRLFMYSNSGKLGTFFKQYITDGFDDHSAAPQKKKQKTATLSSSSTISLVDS
jgi:hypothetical protein